MTGAAWAVASPSVDAGGPIAADQFERHGFVHCCFREQLCEIAMWWFDEEDDDLFVLELDPTSLTPELRFEAPQGVLEAAGRWYPHLFGPIDGGAVVAVHELERDSTGEIALPPTIASPAPGFQVTGRLPGDADEVERVVQWRSGSLSGDDAWIAEAGSALDAGRLVPLIGGISALPDLGRAYETFALLDHVATEICRYEGDGFFVADP